MFTGTRGSIRCPKLCSSDIFGCSPGVFSAKYVLNTNYLCSRRSLQKPTVACAVPHGRPRRGQLHVVDAARPLAVCGLAERRLDSYAEIAAAAAARPAPTDKESGPSAPYRFSLTFPKLMLKLLRVCGSVVDRCVNPNACDCMNGSWVMRKGRGEGLRPSRRLRRLLCQKNVQDFHLRTFSIDLHAHRI
jgi:hypothetical protein